MSLSTIWMIFSLSYPENFQKLRLSRDLSIFHHHGIPWGHWHFSPLCTLPLVSGALLWDLPPMAVKIWCLKMRDIFGNIKWKGSRDGTYLSLQPKFHHLLNSPCRRRFQTYLKSLKAFLKQLEK